MGAICYDGERKKPYRNETTTATCSFLVSEKGNSFQTLLLVCTTDNRFIKNCVLGR